MLTYLSAADIRQCMPSVVVQLELARTALQALASHQAEMPPKIAVHPRHESFLEAMPAWWREGDIAGMKWIAAFPGNRARHLPQVLGVIVLNDAATGVPTCILDAGEITLARTAAVSALALRLTDGSVGTFAILGAGAQARAHLAAVSALGLIDELRVFDRHPERANDLVRWWQSMSATAAPGRACTTAQQAVEGAHVIISCASVAGDRQLLQEAWVHAARVIVAIDEDVYLSAAIVRASQAFVVDEVAQFHSARDQGAFVDFPDPDGILAALPLTDHHGRDHFERTAVVTLGVGLADIIFAAAVYENARATGRGLFLST